MIGLCTDSGGQLPDDLVERYGIEVVPLTVRVDDTDYLEHVELSSDEFYARFEGGHRPQIATAAPSPGRFEDAYQALADRGASEILSVHIGAEISGTLNAANIAAATSPVPVRLVDTGSASFVVGAATWMAADAVARGASAEEAADIAERTARSCGNIFVVNTLDLARQGGRLAPGPGDDGAGAPAGIPVLRLFEGKLDTVGHAATAGAAADAMAAEVRATGQRLDVAIGVSDDSSRAVADALAARLEGDASIVEIARYRVGPSVGAHTGPGTAGAVYWPADRPDAGPG